MSVGVLEDYKLRDLRASHTHNCFLFDEKVFRKRKQLCVCDVCWRKSSVIPRHHEYHVGASGLIQILVAPAFEMRPATDTATCVCVCVCVCVSVCVYIYILLLLLRWEGGGRDATSERDWYLCVCVCVCVVYIYMGFSWSRVINENKSIIFMCLWLSVGAKINQ